MKEFNSVEEMQPYYNKKNNTYEFIEDGERFDVKFNFNLTIESNIYAGNIDAGDINAWGINAGDIYAWDIKAWDIGARNINACNIDARNIDAGDIDAWNINVRDIDAGDINYYAFCIAYNGINCRSIKARRENGFHKALDGDIVIKADKAAKS